MNPCFEEGGLLGRYCKYYIMGSCCTIPPECSKDKETEKGVRFDGGCVKEV